MSHTIPSARLRPTRPLVAALAMAEGGRRSLVSPTPLVDTLLLFGWVQTNGGWFVSFIGELSRGSATTRR